MKYEQRDVFIVKDQTDHSIVKVFGIESEAENYAAKCDNVVIDVWPTEFEVAE